MYERWKYKVLDIRPSRRFLATRPSPEEIQAELDKLGAQGWELVSVIASSAAVPPRMILKRPG
jgi:hypothetical protein